MILVLVWLHLVWWCLRPFICCKWQYFILFNGWVMFHRICISHLLYPLIFCFRLFPWFWLLWTVLQQRTLGYMYLFESWFSSRCMPRDGIARSFGWWFGCSICSFLWNLHTVHSGCTVYIPTNTIGGFPIHHTLSSRYCLLIFLMMAILTGVRWYPHYSFDLCFLNN